MPFGVTGLWPTFGAEPYAKITLKFALAFPELLFKTNGFLITKLDKGDL